MKEQENTEDISKEEYYLYNIISACECILDDMESGANIEQADFNNLGYVDGIMLRMHQNVNKQLTQQIQKMNNIKNKSTLILTEDHNISPKELNLLWQLIDKVVMVKGEDYNVIKARHGKPTKNGHVSSLTKELEN